MPSFFILIGLLYLINCNGLLLAVFFAIVIHESGHLIAMQFCKVHTKKIILSAVGAEIFLNEQKESIWVNAWIQAAGPVFSLLAAVLLAKIGFTLCAGISLFLGLFNSLPILPLDGGRFLQTLLKYIPDWVSDTISFMGAVCLLFAGSFLFFTTKKNFSLFLIGLFLLSQQKCLSLVKKDKKLYHKDDFKKS